MTAPQPDFGTHRYGPLTDSAHAILDAETASRDAKTARLKEARLAKAIEIEPDKLEKQTVKKSRRKPSENK
jgi:hypothetical protein